MPTEWKLIRDNPPPTGTLCLLSAAPGKPSLAVAWRLAKGWRMADVPTPLRGRLFNAGPVYWKEVKLPE